MSVLPPPPGDGDDGQARPEGRPVHHVPPGGPDLPPLPAGVVIPDDLSALEEEVSLVRRELRRERRTARWQSLPVLRRMPARGLPGTFVILSLFAITLLGTMLMAFPPGRGMSRVTARPLASPTQPVGTRGGLLPAVDLVDGAGRETPVRILRPAVVAIVAAGCHCAAALNSVATQAHEFELDTVFVEPKKTLADGDLPLPQLSQDTGLSGYLDPNGRLMSLAPKGSPISLLLVSADGTLARGPIAFTLGQRLEQPLADVAK
jgi:hypothetical protein